MTINRDVTIGLAGDVMMTGRVLEQLERLGSKAWAQHIAEAAATCDVFSVNIECPLTDSDKRSERHYSKLRDFPWGNRVFVRGPKTAAAAVREMGVHVAAIANNHILDYGVIGIRETREALEKEEIQVVGAGENSIEAWQPVIREVRGVKLGFLAASYTCEATRTSAGAAPLWLEALSAEVNALTKKTDIVVLHLHFGVEFASHPQETHRAVARAMIDCGAKVVACHHPHILQSVEHYRDGIIAYSLGNFVYDDRNFGTELLAEMRALTALTTLLRVTVESTGRVTWRAVPLVIKDGVTLTADETMGRKIQGILAGVGAAPSPPPGKAPPILPALALVWHSVVRGELRNLYLLARRGIEAQTVNKLVKQHRKRIHQDSS